MNDLNQMKTGDQEMNTKQIEKTLNNGGLNNVRNKNNVINNIYICIFYFLILFYYYSK